MPAAERMPLGLTYWMSEAGAFVFRRGCLVCVVIRVVSFVVVLLYVSLYVFVSLVLFGGWRFRGQEHARHEEHPEARDERQVG